MACSDVIVMSFYKEELRGEEDNYISLMSQSQGVAKLDILNGAVKQYVKSCIGTCFNNKAYAPVASNSDQASGRVLKPLRISKAVERAVWPDSSDPAWIQPLTKRPQVTTCRHRD